MNSLDYKKYKCFINDESAKNWGRRYYKDFSSKYKEYNQQLAKFDHMHNSSKCVEYFCGHGYREMNNYLRNDTINAAAKSYTEALTFTLLLAPPIPEDIVVYRLVCPEFIEALIKSNSQIIEKGFLSSGMLTSITELNEHYADYDDMLRLYVPKGIRGLYVNEIAPRQENEIILIPNTHIRLIKKSKYKLCNKTIYKCEVLSL